MLEIMRSHKFFSVFLLSAITVMIIITFVFWGVGPRENPSDMVIARIEGEKITQQEYWRAYDNIQQYYRKIYGEEELEKLNLKEKVLNNLIENRVLIIAARTNGVKVTEGELQEAIIANPIFHRNGVFDSGVYMRVLKLNRMTPEMYESATMNELILNKMQRLIGEMAELTVDEKKILDSVKEGKKQLAETLLLSKKELAVKAYIEGLKRQMKIKISRGIDTT